jgi:hypothetical protein
MRYLTIPATITVTAPPELGPAPPEALPFIKFALLCWLDDPRAIEGAFSRQVRWSKVIDAFRAAQPGSVLALEDEDYATLRPIVESPQRRLPPTIATQVLAYSRAVLDAADTAPAPAS